MPICEMCGKETAKVSRTKIEGGVIEACSKCASYGEVLPEPKKARPIPSFSVRSVRVETLAFEDAVVSDFSKRVKDAREHRKMDFKTLAAKMNVKEQLLHRVEQGRLVPDFGFARKIERALGIKLIEKVEEPL
ncbi:MAG: TIGR00270 family protein [Candidatus Aenigmarchaeota archaeon]|nr:TIGR00270 family protein [Candidatus Aenigmarchaeota archaeon]